MSKRRYGRREREWSEPWKVVSRVSVGGCATPRCPMYPQCRSVNGRKPLGQLRGVDRVLLFTLLPLWAVGFGSGLRATALRIDKLCLKPGLHPYGGEICLNPAIDPWLRRAPRKNEAVAREYRIRRWSVIFALAITVDCRTASVRTGCGADCACRPKGGRKPHIKAAVSCGSSV